MERLREIADDHRLGPSTAAIVSAARKRNIPIVRFSPTSSLIQLGFGVHQKRIQASETSMTSSIAVEVCQDKVLTNRLLRPLGLPVPDGEEARSADEAWEVAKDLGLPVVVKPADGNQGKGVSVHLTTEEQVRSAFEIARRFGKVLVEQFIEGRDFRLLIVNGKMVAASRRDPAQVVGDGEHSIEELVEIANRDERRRPGHAGQLTRLEIDESTLLTLAQHGLNPQSIPEAGQVALLRKNANLSTGGTATDVTDEVYPTTIRSAELAAQILALDVAGVDVVARDIRHPLAEQRGAIVEVNAGPGLRMHLSPAEGQRRDVGTPIIDMLYPDGAAARIPIIAITGTNGKTTVTRLIGHMYETARWVVGMTCTDGMYLNKSRVKECDCSGPQSARAILMHPLIEVAVLETARGGILREGLAFDRCTVGVVTNISADHLGLDGIESLEELSRVKQVVIESVDEEDGAAVLNADDPLVAEMAAATGARVIYFSRSPHNSVTRTHLARGGWAVFVENDTIVLAQGDDRLELVELERVPFTMNGKIHFQVMNALAGTAAAWGAGLNPALIARALSTFRSDPSMAPGRFNVMEVGGVEVILDYGHNPGAIASLSEAVLEMGRRKTLLALALPGDRRDEDLVASAQEAAGFADEFVLYDLEDLRGRCEREVPELLARHLPADRPVEFATDQDDAISKAWQRARPGDRVVVIIDKVDGAIDRIRMIGESAGDETCEVPPDSQMR